MDPQKSSKAKSKKRGKLSRTRAVNDSSDDSSSDEKTDEESRNLGSSRLQLLQQERRKSNGSKKSSSREKPESATKAEPPALGNTIVQLESKEKPKPAKPQVPKETSIAQSIKRKLGFFRKSADKSEDVEASTTTTTTTTTHDSPEPKSAHPLMDVVVDVHRETEHQKSKVTKKKVSSKTTADLNKSDDDDDDDDNDDEASPTKSSPEKIVKDSLDLIEEFHEEQVKKVLDSESDDNEAEDDVDKVTSSKAQPTSGGGGGDAHKRKRWDKSEVTAEELVEDLKKPRRRQWAKGAASAQIRNATGKKIVVPKRAATAEPAKSARPSSALPSKPVAAPRVKSLPKADEKRAGYDNDGFSSDHDDDDDEVLRIETVDDSSPKIRIGSRADAEIKDGASTLSEEDDARQPKTTTTTTTTTKDRKFSIEEIKDYVGDSTGNSDAKDRSASGNTESPNFAGKKSTSSRRRSTGRGKSSVDKRKAEDGDLGGEGEEDEEDEDEEEQETVLNVADKPKARRSSSSSKIEIIPSNFFEKESSDETTITTNEEMRTSRRDSRHSSSPRSKSKSSKSSKSSSRQDEASVRSARAKRKTAASSSTRNSANEDVVGLRKKSKSRTRRRAKRKEHQQPEDLEDEEIKYVSVRIHKCDMLEADYVTRHPIVRVHLVYEDTGNYLRQNVVGSSISSSSSSADKDEADEKKQSSDCLRPLLTDKFDFKEKKSMVPVWEEELIFEQSYKDLFASRKETVLILFEVLDLLSSAETSLTSDQYVKDSCWHKVAWAFLRPMGITGVRHVDKRVRLQLYRPKKSYRKLNRDKCEVYKWWKSSSKDKYPSSLYVSVTGVEPPKLEPMFYEQLLEPSEQPAEAPLASESPERLPEQPAKWTRLAAQSCQIPNELYHETEAGDSGCFFVAFSNDGKYLACALSEEYEFPILVYKLDDEGKVHVQFSGHKNFIYSLNWSHDDRYLLSVSSDQTARLWDVQEKIIEHAHALPHPSYVYCGKFAPDSSYIVTGCYDHVARVWGRSRAAKPTSRQYELVQELEAHESFVNAVCFQPKEEACLTADGLGVLVLWTSKRSARGRRSPGRREWQVARKIKLKEAEGVPINSIAMHPLGSRLLVHSRNNGLRLIDLQTGSVVKKFEGLKNQRLQITACISPCGSLLFCGGEDSTLNVWSLENGKLAATYRLAGANQNKAVTCVDYHPYDHVLAFSTYGAPVPVKIFKYDREADGSAVGLQLLMATTNTTTMATTLTTNSASLATSRLYPKDLHPRNGLRKLELSARSLETSATNASQSSINHLLSEYRLPGPNLKTKSMTRLNGIIEKIDRILMYATSQKSPAGADPESAFEDAGAMGGGFELRELRIENELDSKKKNKKKKRQQQQQQRRHRSRSARNACSPTPRDVEFSKAFSDSAAFTRKVSRFSDDSGSNSGSLRLRERLEGVRKDSLKDSLDTIVDDGKEDFPSEEVLDVESLNSDDTYVVNKDKLARRNDEGGGGGGGGGDDSDKSNATFVIESEVPPVPKPRTKRLARIDVIS